MKIIENSDVFWTTAKLELEIPVTIVNVWKPLTTVTGSSIPGFTIVLKYISVKQNIKTPKM